MSVNTVTSSNQWNPPENADGFQIGNAATSKVGFYGATPLVQQSSANQAALAAASVTDASGGTAAATNGILTITGTYNQAILANAIATLAAQVNANSTLVASLRTALVSLGLIKGAA